MTAKAVHPQEVLDCAADCIQDLGERMLFSPFAPNAHYGDNTDIRDETPMDRKSIALYLYSSFVSWGWLRGQSANIAGSLTSKKFCASRMNVRPPW